jgi:hypothetical protein
MTPTPSILQLGSNAGPTIPQRACTTVQGRREAGDIPGGRSRSVSDIVQLHGRKAL